MSADIDTANEIYNDEGIEVLAPSQRVISKEETEATVGHEVDDNWGLNRAYESADGVKHYTDEDMLAVLGKYVNSSVVSGLWAKRVYRPGGELAGTSSREGSFGADHPRLAAVATDFRGPDTFAHELGHVLIDTGHRDSDEDNLMHSGGGRDKDETEADRLSDEEVAAIKGSALGWARDQAE